MAKRRMIDTDGLFFDSELVEALGAEGLLVYVRLWCIAEDWGGYEPNYKNISLDTGALRISPKKIEKFIHALLKMGKIIEYQSAGKNYHWIVNFHQHQTLNNPTPPHIPLPVWISCKIKMNEKTRRKTAEYEVNTGMIPVCCQYDTYAIPVSLEVNRSEENREEVEVEKACAERLEGGGGEVIDSTMRTWDPGVLEALLENCRKNGVELTRKHIDLLGGMSAREREEAVELMIQTQRKRSPLFCGCREERNE